MKQRIEWVDFAKGITIFLVVFGHVNSGLANSEYFVENKKILDLIYEFVSTIRMPLFFMVSGFLYSTKVNRDKTDLKNSILNKLIGLGIPYFVFSVLIWIIKFLMSGNVRVPVDWMSLFLIPVSPIEYFWFLYVLFLLLVITELLDYCFKSRFIVFSIVLTLAVLSWNYTIENYLIRQTMYMMIFFYIGKILRQNSDVLNNKIFIISCLFAFFFLYISRFYVEVNGGVSFLISTTGVFVILSISMRLNKDKSWYKYFASIGKITMPVYLLHPPIASCTRMFLLKIGVDNLVIHFIIGVIFAWFLSILIYKMMNKNKYLDFLFYPSKYWKVTRE